MLAHPRSRVTEQLGQRLQIHAVNDRTGTEGVTRPIKLCINRNSCLVARPFHAKRQVVFIPRCAAMIEKNEFALISLANRNEQLHHNGVQRKTDGVCRDDRPMLAGVPETPHR